MKMSLICYFFYLITKNLRFTRSQNVPNFGMKCSKSLRFLPLRPTPRWGSLQRSPDPLVVRGLLPSAIAASRLQRSQFDLSSHVWKSTQLLDLNFPLQAPLTQFLDPTPYMTSVELTNYRFFCI